MLALKLFENICGNERAGFLVTSGTEDVSISYWDTGSGPKWSARPEYSNRFQALEIPELIRLLEDHNVDIAELEEVVAEATREISKRRPETASVIGGEKFTSIRSDSALRLIIN